MTTIAFLRHAQARNNTERVLAGRSPGVPLTELGIEQARAAAELVGRMGISRIYTSPIDRARHTAEIVGERSSAEVVADDRLIELEMGRFTGMRYDDIMSRHGNVFLKFYSGDPELARNGVETFAEVRGRVMDAVRHAAEAHPGESVLMVTHMDPIKAALSEAVGLRPESLLDLIVANASLTVFAHAGGGLVLRAVNVMDTSRFAQDW